MLYLSPKKSKLDTLARAIVTYYGRCQNPKCVTPISPYNPPCWSHIIPRTCLHLRWSLDNALCLCLKCERYFTDHPNKQKELFISIIGEEKYNELKQSQNRYEYIDYESIEKNLKEVIKMKQIRI